MNDIVWSYNSGGAGRRVLARKHDTLLWYAKGDYVFNVMREPYATGNVSDRVGFHADGLRKIVSLLRFVGLKSNHQFLWFQ